MDTPTRTYKLFNKQIHRAGNYCRLITFPGARGLTFYEVITLFAHGLLKGSLNVRATSIAFHFLLALGPALIFLLSLIPYIPITNFEQGIMQIMFDVIPESSYIAIEQLLGEIFSKHHGITIFGFLVTLFFIQKGLNGIIEAFSASYHQLSMRNWIGRRLVSVGLFIIFFILVTTAAILLFFSNMGIKHLYETGVIRAFETYTLLLVGKWLIILTLTLLAISFLYFLAPARKIKWKLFTPGSIFATALSILTSLIFSYFVNHFAPFNRFFGSIGTLVAVMLWMNFNALALLAGFELNVSIKNARLRKIEPTSI